MVGYVNTARLSTVAVATAKYELRRWALARGLELRQVFTEAHVGDRGAFVALLAELGRDPVRWVIVPSLGHLAVHPRRQAGMLDELAERTGASVLAVDEHSLDRVGAVYAIPATAGSDSEVRVNPCT